MKKNNAVCNWDFTLWDKECLIEVASLRCHLDRIAKKWCFQAEDAGSGRHYQGRLSLKVKKRLGEFALMGAHLSKTSDENQSNDFYVCKEDTRVEGPWRDTDPYVPRQVREVGTLYKWQKYIEDNIHVWAPRTINIIIDKNGNIGKSTLVNYLCTKRGDCRSLPALSNYKDIMAMVMCMPVAKLYLVDMPRAMVKSQQQEFYSAIESIKDGHVFDTRYSFKEKWFDCPNIWIFSNVPPDRNLLSADRWAIWFVDESTCELRRWRCNTN